MEFTSNTNVAITRNANNTIYQPNGFSELSQFEYVDVTVRVVNQFGTSSVSSAERIFISGNCVHTYKNFITICSSFPFLTKVLHHY